MKRAIMMKNPPAFSLLFFALFYLTNIYIFDNYIFSSSYASKCESMDMTAVYPGSFDPITNGHVDIIHRGLRIFERIIVAVLENPKKRPLFTTKERVAMIEDIFRDEQKVEIQSFDGLLVEFVRKNRAQIVMRGLRAISDFEYEFQMALMNRKLDPDIEIFFMMPTLDFSFLSSNLVKEVGSLGGCLEGLVPPEVKNRLKKKFSKRPIKI